MAWINFLCHPEPATAQRAEAPTKDPPKSIFHVSANLWKLVFGLIATFSLIGCSTAPDATATAVPSQAATNTAAPTATPTIEITATPAIAIGSVRVAQAACRVGPGGAYAQRTTLYAGDEVEVLGQMEQNDNWLLLHTASFSCWMGADLVTLPAEVTLAIIENPHAVLPISNYYGPVDNVRASRQGDTVTVRWGPFEPREDDKTENTPYIVEAWVCQNGEFVFRAYGTAERRIEIRDERGACAERSHARVMAAEKHGYTPTRAVPWP